MLALSSLRRRAYAAMGVASVTALVLLSLSGPAAAQPSTTPSEWPVLQLANPGPGDVVSNGDYIVSGMAYDPAATEGAGVGRVDLFLGSRDGGGMFLGSAMPGQDMIPNITPDSQLAMSGFQIKVTLPSTVSGGENLYAYVSSTTTGRETTLEMPIFVGVAPTATPVTSTSAVVSAQAETFHTSAPTTGAGAEMFSLANPGSGDVLLNGSYVVSGATGSTIDSVDFFLDSRDSGGLHLGAVTPTDGTFTLAVTIPTTATGGHNFVAYARSSETGQETQVSTPVFIGVAPTATPRPS